MTKLRFDAQKDLRLIRLIAQTPHVLTVRSAIPANSLDELVKLAKEKPGKMFYASSGNGGAIHLASELFKRETGTVINHIPFRGGGPAVLAVMSGDADVFINDASTTLPNIQAGSLRALAMLSPKRSELLPELPTSAELGYPGIVSSSWTGLAAPANTPEPIVEAPRRGDRQGVRIGRLPGDGQEGRLRAVRLQRRADGGFHQSGSRNLGGGRQVGEYPHRSIDPFNFTTGMERR